MFSNVFKQHHRDRFNILGKTVDLKEFDNTKNLKGSPRIRGGPDNVPITSFHCW
jgi:hypothetical protein